MPVSSTIRSTFDVAKLDDYSEFKRYYSHTLPVFHKDVAVRFALSLLPNDTREDYSDFLGVYLTYVDGPRADMMFSFQLFVVTDTGSVFLANVPNHRLSRVEGFGYPRKLPRSLEALAAGGYLKSYNTLLEIKAKLIIPTEAFDNPNDSCKVLVQPERNQPDLILSYLFRQLSTPAITNQPFSDRFQLRATDGSSFWAHKDILALSSEVFSEWFDPNKPPKAQSKCFKEGVMDVELGKKALAHMLYFLYFGETSKGFNNKFAWEILETAERFRFNKLKRICERSLLDQMNAMPIGDSLFESLSKSDTFGLAQLKTATVNKLVEGLSGKKKLSVSNQEDFLLNVIEFAHQHEQTALKQVCDTKLAGMLQFNVDTGKFLAMVSVARKNDLHKLELGKWCSKWMATNYQTFKDQGHLKELMNDRTEDGQGVIEFLMEIFSNLSLQQRW